MKTTFITSWKIYFKFHFLQKSKMTGLSNPRFPAIQESSGITNIRHKKTARLLRPFF